MSRSLTAGLFTVLPVAVATVLNFGMLGWFDEPLGVTTALLSSMGIGIGVDYAIHFVFPLPARPALAGLSTRRRRCATR